MISFRAEAGLKGIVNLSWETAVEEALRHFVVEAGNNGRDFEEVGPKTPAYRASTYALVDDRPWKTHGRYYRLRRVPSGVYWLRAGDQVKKVIVGE